MNGLILVGRPSPVERAPIRVREPVDVEHVRVRTSIRADFDDKDLESGVFGKADRDCSACSATAHDDIVEGLAYGDAGVIRDAGGACRSNEERSLSGQEGSAGPHLVEEED